MTIDHPTAGTVRPLAHPVRYDGAVTAMVLSRPAKLNGSPGSSGATAPST